MTTQDNLNYNRIEEAIGYIISNFKNQPELEEIAAHVHISPFHFQKIFTDWAGVSPKKFLQYLSIEHAKKMLVNHKISLSDAAFESGLSGTGRLHDLFISIEGMTPGEFKNGGENLHINYSFVQTYFGDLIIASTAKGICYMAFADNISEGFKNLQTYFPRAVFTQKTDFIQQQALYIFSQNWQQPEQIKLHIKGTAFQLKVWETLLSVPQGKLSTYANIAASINNHTAVRAVGSAVANNPIAYIIPCHRVISSIQNLGEINLFCSDKTGTLTEGILQVHSVIDIDGNENAYTKQLAFLNAHFESGFANPMDEALTTMQNVSADGYNKANEVPYDFNRKD